jgi:hypothetical protein
VFALSAGGDFDTFPQQIKAFCDRRVVCRPQVVEGSHADRILGDENELVTISLADQRRQQPLTFVV